MTRRWCWDCFCAWMDEYHLTGHKLEVDDTLIIVESNTCELCPLWSIEEQLN